MNFIRDREPRRRDGQDHCDPGRARRLTGRPDRERQDEGTEDFECDGSHTAGLHEGIEQYAEQLDNEQDRRRVARDLPYHAAIGYDPHCRTIPMDRLVSVVIQGGIADNSAT
jgi:hypothetical protein